MKSNFAKVVLLSVALVLFAGLLWFYFPSSNKLTRVAVLGDAKAKLSPDTAVITFSVVTQNKEALKAQTENAKKSEAVKKAVETAVADAKIEFKTDAYNLEPEEDYSSDRMPKIIGYEVKNTVSIYINDLKKVGSVIDAATKAGANSVEGVSFVIGESSPTQGGALALATKQAMAKAEAIAKSLNGRVVRVVETREGGVPDLPEFDSAYFGNTNASANSEMDFKTPIQAGSVEMRSQVLLIVEIEIG